MYKDSAIVALFSDYEDTAKKYMEAWHSDAELSERYLCRMKLIGKAIDTLVRMKDGTMGKAPAAQPHPVNQAMASAVPGMGKGA